MTSRKIVTVDAILGSGAKGHLSAGRPVKRRASKACHSCRSRKVKCSVVKTGIPCQNCRLGHVECVVSQARRRRRAYAEKALVNHRSTTVDDDLEEGALPPRDMTAKLDNFLATAPQSLDFKLSNHIHDATSLMHLCCTICMCPY